MVVDDLIFVKRQKARECSEQRALTLLSMALKMITISSTHQKVLNKAFVLFYYEIICSPAGGNDLSRERTGRLHEQTKGYF